jgi:hypothetical protein
MLGRANADTVASGVRAAAGTARGYGAKASRAARGYGAQAGAAVHAAAKDPMGTAVRGAKATFNHVKRNRGGYGLSAGYELGSRYGGAE